MNVLLATPNFHQPRGNTVTVQRISEGLQSLGVKTQIVSITDEDIITTLPPADVIHGFHAYRFYTFKEKLTHKIDSYVITLTGTDLNHDLFNADRRNDVLHCLTVAKAIHVFDHKARQTLLNEAPELGNKIHTIHQGTSVFSPGNYKHTKEKNTFLFVLPAGIRKVKNIPAAISMLRTLHNRFPAVRLWLVGPVIEEEEGKIVMDLVDQNSQWIDYIGQLSHIEMGTIYQQADVILNTSLSEGQSAAILEGMAHGVPVLVSGNQGNRSIVSDRLTGLIYDTPSQFLAYAEEIMNNIKLRNQIGQAAKQYISQNHSPTFEAEQLLKIYKDIL